MSQEDFEEKGTGSYIWEDHFYPEVVDRDTGEPLPHGEEGVLVFTTLTKEAMPLLRYWTNDICSIFYDKNAKRTHIKMSAIKGRADDMLIIRGVNLFHTQVEELIKDVEELAVNYQLVVTREGTMDEVKLDIEIAESISNKIGAIDFSKNPTVIKLKNKLQQKIKNNIGLSMEVEVKSFGTIPRSAGGKLSRVKDLRKI